MASPNLSEILTTTLQDQSEEWFDNFTENNAFFLTLKKKGLIEKVSGGYDLRHPLMYAENSTGMWFTGYQQLDITPQDVLTASQFAWKQYAIAVSASGYEIRVNSGNKHQLKQLLAARIENAKKTMANDLDEALFGDGTGDSGKTLTGIQAALPTSNSTGTYGNISRASWTFWRHIVRQSSAFVSGGRTAANFFSECDAVLNQLVRGREKIDIVLCGNTDFGYGLEALRSRQIITDSKMAEAGFDAFKHRGAEFVLCGGNGGHITDTYMYFLNTDYWKLQVHSDLFMEPIDPANRTSVDQDALVKLMGSMCNLTNGNLRQQALLY